LSERTSLGLVSERVDSLGSGTDEGDASGFDLLGELVVLRKETVSAMEPV